MSEKGSGLLRAISPFGAMLLVLNGMIGAGIFVLPGSVSAMVGGWAPWLFLLVGALFVTVALTFGELASFFRESGGPVMYARTAFGPAAGFGTGWLLWLGRVTAIGANIGVVATSAGSFWPAAGTGGGRVALLGAICAFLVVTNIAGVKQGVRTVGILTVLKVTPLFALLALGLAQTDVVNLTPGPVPDFGTIGAASLLLIYGLVGFEGAAVTAGETKNPRRSLPRALVVTVIATAAFYSLLTLIYVAVLPNGGAEKKTLVDVAGALAGPAAATAMTVALIFSVFGNVASAMVTSPRLTYSLAENGLLPRWFGHVHPKFATPDNSILLFGVAVFALAASSSFVALAVASSLARILIYILCVLALPRLRKSHGNEPDSLRLPGGFLIPGTALFLCVVASFQARSETWALLAGLVAIGAVLFWLARRAQRSAGV